MKRVYLFAILLAVLLFYFTCVRDAPAQLPSPPTIGAQDDHATAFEPSLLGEAFTRARSIHARYWRVIVRANQPLEGYDWGIQQAKANGFRVQVTLTNYDDEAWVIGALQRWAPYVDYWSFWNEPELFGGIPHYIRVYKVGYRVARRYDPTAKILIGEVSAHATFRQVRQLDHLKGDGLAIHPYQGLHAAPAYRGWNPLIQQNCGPKKTRHVCTNFTTMSQIPALHRYLQHKDGRRTHRLFITEFGYISTQSRWLGNAYRTALAAGCREFLIYQLFPDPFSNWDTSLYNPDGSSRVGHLTLNRSYTSTLRLMRWLQRHHKKRWPKLSTR